MEKKINSLRSEKSQGPDQICPKLLKECSTTLSKPLILIFNRLLMEGKLPTDWKKANITPIHKGGDKTEPSNYRPISLTSVPCILLEAIIVEKVKEHLRSLEVPSDVQHGFVSG